MPSHKYIFEAFIQECQELDRDAAIVRAKDALELTERELIADKPFSAPKLVFANRLRALIAFLEHGVLTAQFEEDSQAYKQLSKVGVGLKD